MCIRDSFSTVQGTPTDSQVVSVSGERLESNIQLSFVLNSHFEMKKETDPDTAWSKSLIITPVDSTVTNEKILVRYNPSEPSFGAIQNDFLVMTSQNAEKAVSYTHLRAHETRHDLVCR